MNGFDFYHGSIPDFLGRLCETPPMRRLKDVGMNCGCEYTRFPRFVKCAPYSRFEHSLGVGLIVWHFTGDVKQSAAGLLHDIATPVFAHVIDFLRGDHLTQESTEDGTRQMIEKSAEIQAELKCIGATTDEVADYHLYPIADNDTPRLSADRLEYTLGNIVNYRFAGIDTVKRLYDDLIVHTNEYGEDEIMFQSYACAREFAFLMLKCANVYISDEDRFAMQALAEILRSAIRHNVLSVADLDTTEPQVIQKLCASPEYHAQWNRFRACHEMQVSHEPRPGWLRIPAKKRYIDPYIMGEGRLSALDREFSEAIAEFRTRPLDAYLMGK